MNSAIRIYTLFFICSFLMIIFMISSDGLKSSSYLYSNLNSNVDSSAVSTSAKLSLSSSSSKIKSGSGSGSGSLASQSYFTSSRSYWILKERINSSSAKIPILLLVFDLENTSGDKQGEFYGLSDDFSQITFKYQSLGGPIVSKEFSLCPDSNNANDTSSNKLIFNHIVTDKTNKYNCATINAANSTTLEKWIFTRLSLENAQNWKIFFDMLKQESQLSGIERPTDKATSSQATQDQLKTAMNDVHLPLGIRSPVQCLDCHVMIENIGKRYAKGKHFVKGKFVATCNECHHGQGLWHGFVEDTAITGGIHLKSLIEMKINALRKAELDEMNLKTLKQMEKTFNILPSPSQETLSKYENYLNNLIKNKIGKDVSSVTGKFKKIISAIKPNTEQLFAKAYSAPYLAYNFYKWIEGDEKQFKRQATEYEKMLGFLAKLTQTRYLRRGSEECKACHKLHESKEMQINLQSSFARKAHVQANMKVDNTGYTMNCIRCHKNGVGHEAPPLNATEGLPL